MRVTELPLAGLKLVELDVYADERGTFAETYHEPRYRAAGIDCRFVQDNCSRSRAGTLRGLHYQLRPGQAKLVQVTLGRTFDVAVDLRPASPTFGRWYATELSAEVPLQIFIPVGFAHGFCALSEQADVAYKVSAVYDRDAERQLRWDDPELAITWPFQTPLVSARDAGAESFAAFARRMRGA